MVRSKMSSPSSVRATKLSLAQMSSPLSARNTTTGSGVLRRLFLLMESTPPVMVSMYCITLRRRRAFW